MAMNDESSETGPRADTHQSIKRRNSFDQFNPPRKRIRNEETFEGPCAENLDTVSSPPDASDHESGQSSLTESRSILSSAEEGSFTSNTSLSTPSRRSPSRPTHDDSRSAFHIKDLTTFATTLEEAAKSAFPNRGRSRYATVHVCLIRWEVDDAVGALGFEEEVNSLCDVFERCYGFKVETYKIPIVKSHRKLMGMALDFIEEFDARDNLFIVYYAGHGTINDNRQSVWSHTRDPRSASVDWSSIQSLFENTSSDTLFLFDCCAAASSANNSGSGTIETIGACGFEGRAPPPGKYSFTNALVEVLEDWKSKPFFPVSLLHAEVLRQLKRKRPEKGREGTRLEWCTTPVHYIASPDPRPQSIELCRISQADQTLPPVPPIQPSKSDASLDGLQEEQAIELMSTHPNGDLKHPHVLLSVALEEDQDNLHPEQFQRWLSRIPAFVKYVKVEGCFKSYSTLVLLSLPVAIWNLLPNDPACCFIGYVASRNLAWAEDAVLDDTAPRPLMFDASGREIHPDLDTNDQPTDPIARWYDSQGDPSDICGPQSPSYTEQSHFVAGSDSGYGSLRGFGNSSVFSYDFGTPRQETHSSLAGQLFPEEAPSPDNDQTSNLICPTCHKQVKTQSDLKKHDLRHRKPYLCEFPGCSRTEGFSTINDLDRHVKSRHPTEMDHTYVKKYRCTVAGCKSKDKAWPRLDNLRSHLKRAHKLCDDELEVAIRRSELSELSKQPVKGSWSTLDFQKFKQAAPITAPSNPATAVMPPPSLQPLGHPRFTNLPSITEAGDTSISMPRFNYFPTTAHPPGQDGTLTDETQLFDPTDAFLNGLSEDDKAIVRGLGFEWKPTPK